MSTTANTQSAANVLASINTRSAPVAKADEDMGARFLTLLTTQLKNQDPLSPMENAEVTSQLAQMSTVDGIERLNSMFKAFLEGQNANDSMQAAALVGRGVLVEGKHLALTESGAIGGFELDAPADKVVLSIKDASGLEVKQIQIDDVDAGSQNFIWDGTANDGARAADGVYTLELSATLEGQKVVGRSLEFGPVTSVIRGPKGTDFQVGSLGVFKYDDIKQIL
ncbi:MAG TPA: flagellar hook assembly protein FlgD [Thauera sp.]|jgi:flagellar basal-body rod modification protein FlgD|nr:flagellar hook assembly protein FlgD [Thauera sp.]HRA80714.1 flagellar hook assembly protein FlgD [Thauera sp.]